MKTGSLEEMNWINEMMNVRNEIEFVFKLISHLSMLENSIPFRSKILEDLTEKYVEMGITLHRNGGVIPSHMLR